MVDRSDYEDILDDNVSDAEKEIRDLDDPDYSLLLDIEEENKDRKTIKEFLENKIESNDTDKEQGSEEESKDEELVEEIEEQTSSGLFGNYSRQSLAAGGLILGLLVGLAVGLGLPDMVSQDDPTEAENSIQELLDASGVQGANVVSTEERNGLYYVSVELSSESQNQSTTESFYVTKNGELVFPEVRSPMLTSPINVEETVQQLQNQQNSTQQ